jgi:hypothetical protein
MIRDDKSKLGHAKQCPWGRHLISMLKKEIKNKINGDKITFYTFKTLNAEFPRKYFHNNLLN